MEKYVDYSKATLQTVADIFGVTRQAVSKWRDKGMPCYKSHNGRIVFDMPDVIKWHLEQANPRTADPNKSLGADYLIEQARGIVETDKSGVARVNAMKFLADALDRKEAEEAAKESAGQDVIFIEIDNQEGVIKALEGCSMVCPDCGEIARSEA